MQLVENIKTFPVQILHHIQKSKCVPHGHRRHRGARADEIPADVAEAHKLPVRLHSYVSTCPPIDTEHRLQGATPFDVTGNAGRGQSPGPRACL